jgi:hypothetical protein
VADDEADRAALRAAQAEQRGGDLRLVDRTQADQVLAHFEDAAVIARDAVFAGQCRRAVEIEHPIGERRPGDRELVEQVAHVASRIGALAVEEGGDAHRSIEVGRDLARARRQLERLGRGQVEALVVARGEQLEGDDEDECQRHLQDELHPAAHRRRQQRALRHLSALPANCAWRATAR